MPNGNSKTGKIRAHSQGLRKPLTPNYTQRETRKKNFKSYRVISCVLIGLLTELAWLTCKSFYTSRVRSSVCAIADESGRVLEYWDYRVIGDFRIVGTTLTGGKAL